MLLMRLKGDYKNHQYYIDQIIRLNFIYIQILVNLPQEVLYIRFRMANSELIAYASKRLPEVAQNYSITELELCGLAVNIVSFAYLLKKVDFVATIYYLALTHIIKGKAEPATNRTKTLLEVLSSYSFNLYYINGKDMIISDFLSRQKYDKVIQMKSYQYLFTCMKYYMLNITIYLRMNKDIFDPNEI